MNFSLPRIFVLLCGDSINNFKFSVRPATPTLEFSLHQTKSLGSVSAMASPSRANKWSLFMSKDHRFIP